MPDRRTFWSRFGGAGIDPEAAGPSRVVEGFDDLIRTEQERDQLLHAKEQAEIQAKARMDYFATLSHEIRTPLNGVLGMLQLLRETPLQPDQQEFVDTALGSGDCLLDLIENVLDLSRLESNELLMESIPFDLGSLVADVVGLFSAQAKQKGLSLTCRVPAELAVWVDGDPLRIKQILNNLISNAIKFTVRGEVGLMLNLESRENNGAFVSFFVRDTGIGIATDRQKRIFDSFSQAEVSTARRYGGSGLGLAICRKLAERMGGHMSLSSEKGDGSCFGVHIPLRFSDPAVVTAEISQIKADRSDLGALHILVVEDNLVNQKVAVGMLEQLGCRVSVAGNGEEALVAWDADQYDLIFMDCEMPYLDGMEAARRIRELEKPGEPRIPIIAMTGHVLPAEQQRCRQAGMDGCIHKPITLANVRQTISHYLTLDS